MHMCLKPVLIDNINYGNKSKLGYLYDTTSRKIAVPCGRCSVCLSLKQQYLVQRVQMEALNHDLYFGTLTYNNENLPIYEIDDFCIAYSDYSHWQDMIKRIRKYPNIPPFKYLLCSEYGGKRHRPHFHFLLSFPKQDMNLAERWAFGDMLHDLFLKEWRVNLAILPDKFKKDGTPKKNTRRPQWSNLCTYVRTRKRWNFDLHYCDPWTSPNGMDDVAFYVSKYVLKYDKWIDKFKSKLFFSLEHDDYVETWNTIKPIRLMSKHFGSPDDPDVINHVYKGIQLALDVSDAIYPYFISPVDGSTYPLAPYYSKRFLRLWQVEIFNSRKPRLTDYDMMTADLNDLALYEVLEKERRFDAIRDHLDSMHTYEDDEMNDINNFNVQYYERLRISSSELAKDFADSWKDF